MSKQKKRISAVRKKQHLLDIEKRNIEKIKKEIDGMVLFPNSSKIKEIKIVKPSKPFRRASTNAYPSVVLTTPKSIKKIAYEGDMAVREALAQEEIERKKLRVAPAFSKGAYQYITDDTDLKTLGKKV